MKELYATTMDKVGGKDTKKNTRQIPGAFSTQQKRSTFGQAGRFFVSKALLCFRFITAWQKYKKFRFRNIIQKKKPPLDNGGYVKQL